MCNNCTVENKWWKLTCGKKSYTIASIYRHPNGNIDHFVESLNRQISKVDKNSTCIIAGDVNIDLIKTNNKKVNSYTDTLLEQNFIPCISIPSRFTEISATLIDHISIRVPTNKINYKLSAGNLINDITDHMPNFVIMDEQLNTSKTRPWIRIFNRKNVLNFKDKVNEEPSLLPYPLNNNVNSVLAGFSHNLNN